MTGKTYEQALTVVENYEKKLRVQGALVADKTIEIRKDTVKNFLIDFLYYNSVYISDYGSKPFNNTNRVGGNKETKDSSYCGARRSISDLFRLGLNYYGDYITLLEVMEGMYDICNNNVLIQNKDAAKRKYSYEVYNSICSTVYRRVFNLSAAGSNRTYRLNSSASSSVQQPGSDEADIHLQDYITLFSPESKRDRELAKKKKEDAERAAKAATIKSKFQDIDKAVEAKIKEMMSNPASDRLSLVKAVRKINKTSGVTKKRAVV